MSGKIVPYHPIRASESDAKGDGGRSICEVGGDVDECHVTLAIYGENLEPDEVTALLGVTPSSQHRKGDRKGPRSAPAPRGAWFKELQVIAPRGPHDAIEELLRILPEAEETWRGLAAEYDVELSFGIFFKGWNRGFDLAAELIPRLARLHARLSFDLYAEGEEQ